MKHNQQMKCFIVDDDLFTANLFKKIISQKGYKDVTIFPSGVEALNELHHQPKVILLDIQMEILNGFEVLKKIKRVLPDVYIIMVSGQDDMKMALDTLRYGALDYVIKNENAEQEILKALTKIEAIEESLRKKRPSLLRKLTSVFI